MIRHIDLHSDRTIIGVFLCTGSHGHWTVAKNDSARIDLSPDERHYVVTRHDGGIVLLPVEHCGVELSPLRSSHD